MGQNLGDRARSGQRPPSAFCMSLLHHTTIGTVQSVDFAHSDCKMATSLPHTLKIKQYSFVEGGGVSFVAGGGEPRMPSPSATSPSGVVLMSYFTYANESVFTRMDGSCHTSEWFIWHIWIRASSAPSPSTTSPSDAVLMRPSVSSRFEKIYIYIYIHIYIHMYTYINIHMYMHICICIRT